MASTEWVLLVVLSVLWGGSFFFVGIIVRELSPFTIVLIALSHHAASPPSGSGMIGGVVTGVIVAAGNGTTRDTPERLARSAWRRFW